MLEDGSGGRADVGELRRGGVVGGGVTPEVYAGVGEGAGEEASGGEVGGRRENHSSDGGDGEFAGWGGGVGA